MKKSLLIATLAALSLSSNAEETSSVSTTNGILGGGYAFGGEKLEGAEFTDGSSESVKTGEGLWVDLGFRTSFDSWAVKGTLGYKFDSINADNGDISFDRLPITFIGQYVNGDNNFGLGFTYELNPSLRVDVPGDNYSVDFKNSLGFVLEYERSQGNWSWGVRYTMIDYDPDTYRDSFNGSLDVSFAPAVDGNNIGLFANWYF